MKKALTGKTDFFSKEYHFLQETKWWQLKQGGPHSWNYEIVIRFTLIPSLYSAGPYMVSRMVADCSGMESIFHSSFAFTSVKLGGVEDYSVIKKTSRASLEKG